MMHINLAHPSRSPGAGSLRPAPSARSGAFGQELAAATARATPMASPSPVVPLAGGEAPPAPPAPPEAPPGGSISGGSPAVGSGATSESAAAAGGSPLLDRLGISPGLARLLRLARAHVPPGATLQIFSREPGRFRGRFVAPGAAVGPRGASDGLPSLPDDATAGGADSGSLLPPLLPGEAGIPSPPASTPADPRG